MARNLYRIDDTLLRAGALSAFAVLAALVGVALSGLAAGPADGSDPALGALGDHARWLVPAALCPIVLLATGLSVRRREQKIAAIWRLLEQNAEISLPGLLANSDFERRDVERAVRFLNNRGLDHYLWDRESDTIQDAQLQTSYLHIDKCDACGASVALDVPIAFHEIPRCQSCSEPVAFESLQELRRDAIEALRAEHRAARPRRGRIDADERFSLGLFLILLVVFWPAAAVYAWIKWEGRF